MICPKCKSTNIRTERSPIGEIRCSDCDFVIKERGSKEKILPITEQDYPMPPVKEPKSMIVKGCTECEYPTNRVQKAEQRALFLEELMLEIYKETSVEKIKQISGFAIQSNKFI